MNRRSALGALASAVLAACGGGGGGGGSAGSGAAPSAQAAGSTFAGPSKVALWGDSMVPPVATALQLLDPGRAVFDGGVPGETSMQVLARQAADSAHRDWINVFWFGHNNVRMDETAAAAQVKADMAAAISLLAPGNNRFIVLSVVNNAFTAVRGSSQYGVVTQLDADLAATYPANYFDMRAFMVAQSSPIDWQGSTDLANDVPASALRADDIHLNGFGAEVVATRLKALLDQRGW